MKELPHSVEGGLLNRVWVPGETDGSAPPENTGPVCPAAWLCPLLPALSCALLFD